MSRYVPQIGKVHLHRDSDRRFRYTPVEILAEATNWEPRGDQNTRWSSASILKTSRGKYVYTTEDVTLWQGEHSSHCCAVYETLEELIQELGSKPFIEELKDELAKSGYIDEEELFPEV